MKYDHICELDDWTLICLLDSTLLKINYLMKGSEENEREDFRIY